MASPRRSPVRVESYLINSIGICWPQIKNRKIQLQMNILAEMLHDELNAKSDKKIIKNNKRIDGAHTEAEEIKYFIAYFTKIIFFVSLKLSVINL